ncbi:MAG: Protein of unknown function precursor [Bacteroidetes bacterium]|nr:Protein of unknown function precursor [Bacteroidota bacterium]
MNKLFAGCNLSFLGLNKRGMAICVCSLGLMLFMGSTAMAGAPRGINYQGVVRNNTGTIVASQPVGLRFSIHKDNVAGAIIYQETGTVSTNAFGVITVIIGGGNTVQGNIDSIDWSATNYFIQVELDAAGGTSYVDMGTTQFMSVPYALYAKAAGVMTLMKDTIATVTGNTTITVTPTTSYLRIGSSVAAAFANVNLTNGIVPGQCIVLEGASTGTNGVHFENLGNIKIGSVGPLSLLANDILTLIWNGNQWVRTAYSSNQ